MVVGRLKRKKVKKPSKKTLKRKCDKLYSDIIRSKKYCEMCQKLGTDTHHVITRRNLTLRFELSNGVLLCKSCHVFSLKSAHQDPLGFMEWFKKVRGVDYLYLKVNRNILSPQFDYEKKLKELNEAFNNILS